MDVFLVRVWRLGEDGTPFGPQELSGEVEHLPSRWRVPFTSTEALLDVLRGDGLVDRVDVREDHAARVDV